jgi:hypothetical protein
MHAAQNRLKFIKKKARVAGLSSFPELLVSFRFQIKQNKILGRDVYSGAACAPDNMVI